MDRTELMLKTWDRLNAETFHFMRALDFWIMFLLALLVVLMYISRQPNCGDFAVYAAILGALAPLWIGRIDVLLHRPVPAVKEIEWQINTSLQADFPMDKKKSIGDLAMDPHWRTWENYYKPRLKTGVKVIGALDALVLVFLLILFLRANHDSHVYLSSIGFPLAHLVWWLCLSVFLAGIVVIAFAKPLAE